MLRLKISVGGIKFVVRCSIRELIILCFLVLGKAHLLTLIIGAIRQ
jgi:hypothetical protein